MSYLISTSTEINVILETLNLYQFCIVVDEENNCIGTITDGDLRRALIKDTNTKLNAGNICEKNFKYAFTDYEAETKYKDLKFVPIVDKKMKYKSTFVKKNIRNLMREVPLVVMAGGKGTRMKHYTKNIPKPLLEIKGKPILELIINKAKKSGINDIYISINYLGEKIKDYFDNGSKFGVNIKYLEESKELGTAGSLREDLLFKYSQIIVINGDVLSDLSFQLFYRFHLCRENSATIAVKKHSIMNPYGVVAFNGLEYLGMEEKPIYDSFINAGIYILNTKILKLINKNEFIDTPTLLGRAMKNNFKCEIYPFESSWHDIGNIKIYEELNQ